jgi:hypothetical protein
MLTNLVTWSVEKKDTEQCTFSQQWTAWYCAPLQCQTKGHRCIIKRCGASLSNEEVRPTSTGSYATLLPELLPLAFSKSLKGNYINVCTEGVGVRVFTFTFTFKVYRNINLTHSETCHTSHTLKMRIYVTSCSFENADHYGGVVLEQYNILARKGEGNIKLDSCRCRWDNIKTDLREIKV